MGRLAMIALITAASLGITALSVYAYTAIQRAQSSQQALAQVTSLVNVAREDARTSANGGTTIIFQADAYSNVKVTVYDGRPNLMGVITVPTVYAQTTLSPNVTVTAPGIATALPFSIVFNSDGTGEVFNWSPAMGKPASEPTCAAGTQTLTFAVGSVTTSGTFNCQTGLLQ